VKKTTLLDTATTPDGRPMTLLAHDDDRIIRVDGIDLMSTRQHHSEERLGRLACAHLAATRGSRVLVGGLGMGFTLRAVLAALPADAEVVVAEIMPAVIRWNRDPAFALGADCLADRRVEIMEGDVADLLRDGAGRYDTVILDVDNGTSALTARGNERLYRAAGVGLARKALRHGGTAAYWSAYDDPAFAELLEASGFAVSVERVRPHAKAAGGGWHFLFIARVAAPGQRR
jgi:spermidine synthase